MHIDMDEDLTGLNAYAWNLHKDPYYSDGGRLMRPRNIWIMTIDNYFAAGFETVGRKPRYSVIRYASADKAQKAAIKETQRREKEGFELHGYVRTAVTKGGKRGWLEGLTTSDEDHHDLHLSILHCIEKGKVLGEPSPAVSPVSTP
jgi:hypothetical protein